LKNARGVCNTHEVKGIELQQQLDRAVQQSLKTPQNSSGRVKELEAKVDDLQRSSSEKIAQLEQRLSQSQVQCATAELKVAELEQKNKTDQEKISQLENRVIVIDDFRPPTPPLPEDFQVPPPPPELPTIEIKTIDSTKLKIKKSEVSTSKKHVEVENDTMDDIVEELKRGVKLRKAKAQPPAKPQTKVPPPINPPSSSKGNNCLHLKRRPKSVSEPEVSGVDVSNLGAMTNDLDKMKQQRIATNKKSPAPRNSETLTNLLKELDELEKLSEQ